MYIAKDGQTYRYLANNANFESYIKIVKVDAETGKVIPYAGASFQLYRPDGSLITQTFTYPEVTTIDTFYTNDEGYSITPEKLEYGSGFSLAEVFAPYDYTLNSEPVYFDVTQDASTDEGGVTVIEVVKKNTAQKGVIKISKGGEVFSSVTESDELYQPVFSVQGLPDAVYEITAAEDIITPDGTTRYSKGEVVDTVTTDETGLAESKPLYLRKFEIREITTPYGMILNEEIRTAELVYAGQEIEITETSASFYNERQKAAVSLDKVLEQNTQFGVGMNGEISAVTFGLFAAEDLTAADGSVIPADGLLEILSVNENGHAVCKTDLPFGNIYLKELSTDEHYILSDKKYPIVFDYAGQETVLVEIKANDGKPIDNNLIYGVYFVKEQKAPEGFYLDDNAYYFEITENDKTVIVENEAGKGFVNAPQVGSLKIIKTASDNKIEGFSFRVTGPNGYSEIFTTDKNGKILIENLRIGEYVISEVSDGASAAYILPADKTASVFEGAITKVEMHNELRNTPKTGDDSNPALWFALLGISAVGAATLGVIGWKKLWAL